MKLFLSSNLLRNSIFFKISAFVLISVACFFLGKHWSEDGFRRLIFFSAEPSRSPIVTLSPDFGKTYNISGLIYESHPILPPSLSPPPPPDSVELKVFGIVNENGTMSDEFQIGDYDVESAETLGNQTEFESSDDDDIKSTTARVSVRKFEICSENMTEYIPCLDNVEAIKRLNSTARGERFERNCPNDGMGLNCTVPIPQGYRSPIPWPRSRDEVWFNNVPHTKLVEDKGGQNWIYKENDKFKFPGGGTQFIHGADQYLDQISQMIPDISFGNHTRVVLDIGCGVASFGAYLMSRNVLTMSIAPKDVHENQIQFALERGVPAMVAAFTTRRLLYPSQAFDLVHCSRCRINWTRDDGILLLEVNRMLRAGGYFVWAAQPVYKHEKALEEQWEEMLNLTTRLCWVLVKKEGYIAIWQKPVNNTCYLSRGAGVSPPLCNSEDDPDNVWYVDLKACITRIEENGYGANLAPWPARLLTPPDRLQTIQIDSYIARKELFVAESKYWKEIISNYVNALHWKQIGLRNVLDMRAGFGGFAAALAELKVDCWVLNVIPVSGPNTLPVIYDRGLLGVMHDWCEPFDTYPRTYDLLHAAGLFSIERKRCNMTTMMLEMDRILRPGGRVYIRDTINVTSELQEIGNAMRWHTSLRETAEGPHSSYRVLLCEKRFESSEKRRTKKRRKTKGKRA
ncbi:S-adenosyl-L-methionine-dependent methyltransferase [Arabidopsis suecica]|uniref:Methyltransferase n=1 Tax=Arabidopsis suecica TaxID=45249 RepID=A0A8T2DGC5_ARASU|nr:S-adenosyl-L-methionine-dependent methyltransferase [Arabidopsis suecica]